MVGGVAYTLIANLAFGSNAADAPEYVRIGLFYTGSSVTPPKSSYTLASEAGFLVGSLDTKYNFTTAKKITATTVTVSCASANVTQSSGMAILDGSGNKLYEGTDRMFLCAADGGYVSISGSNTYPGYLRFLRNASNMQVVNYVKLEDYIAGVIPNEIGSSYPEEAQKAFAVVVRSYTLTSLNRHSSAEFDLCWTSHCQVYRGRKNLKEIHERVTKATAGMVMTYGGKVVQAYYSSSTGGCTCGVYETWGSSVDYLKAIATPWEHYEKETHGAWTIEYTPAELKSQLQSKGYSLSGNVASVEITKFAENSSYVYNAKVTDTTGKSVTINRADKIRSAFGLYSANFVVGKAGSTVKRKVYVPIDGTVQNPTLTVMTSSGKVSADAPDNYTVATASGNVTANTGGSAKVYTAYGTFDVRGGSSTPWTSELERLVFSKKTETTETVTLKGTSGNFVFDGRGWGHGVGMSQQGIKDLGLLGANFKQILTAYFSGISVVNYKNV